MIIMIPPSEGKFDGGDQKPLGKLPATVQPIYDELQTYSFDLAKLYGVKGVALQKAVIVNENIPTAPTCKAIERYTGVVYSGISYHTLKADAKARADKSIHMVSAMFGLIRADTLIPNYKLKIDKIETWKYWKPIIGKQLKSEFVVDLLPQSHRKAVYYKDGVRVEFIIRKSGDKKPAGHEGKLIKGKFIRWLIVNNIQTPEQMLAFDQDGYEGERVNKQLIEFTRFD